MAESHKQSESQIVNPADVSMEQKAKAPDKQTDDPNDPLLYLSLQQEMSGLKKE